MLASYDNETGKIGGLIASIKKIQELPKVTEEVSNGFDKLFEKIGDTSNLNGWVGQFNTLSEVCGVTDETFADFLKTTQESGTVYKTSEEAIAGYQSYLKSVGTTTDWAAIKTKALSASMKVLSSIGWAVAISAVTKVIGLGIEAIDNYIHRVDIANEAMDEAVSSYEAAKNELENLTSELEENQKQLDELLAKDKLTYAEKGQLEELQAITKELQIQEEIAERNETRSAKEAAEKTVDAYKKQYGDYDFSEERIEQIIGDATSGGTNAWVYSEGDYDLSAVIAQLEMTQKLLDETENKLSDTEGMTEDEITSLEKEYQDYIDVIDEQGEFLDTSLSDLAEKQQNLQSGYDEAIQKQIDGETLTSSEKDIIAAYEAISDAIKLIYQYIDSDSWNNMQINDIFNTDGIEKTKDELIELAQAGKLTPKTLAEDFPKLNAAIKESEITVDEFCNQINATAEEETLHGTIIGSLTKSYDTLTESSESASDSVSTLRSSISTLNDAFAEQAENGSISIDTMLSLVEAGYASALSFDAETGACKIDTEAMLELMQAKINVQIADLKLLKTDIADKLRDEGLAANEAASGYLNLAKAKLTAEQATAVDEYNNASAQIKALQNVIDNLSSISVGSYSTSYSSGSSSSNASSSTDTWKEAFEEEYNALKHNLEMEYITEKQYYDSLAALNNKYFAGKEEYLDEYQKYEEEVYKGLQSYYKDYVEDMMDYQEKALASGKISYKQYCTSVKSMLEDMYTEGKISAQDYYDYIGSMLETQLSIYDKVISAVVRRIEKEIDGIQDIIDGLETQNDALNDQIDDYDKILSVVDSVYEKQIQALEEEKQLLQDKIDAIEDTNSELDLQYRKEQALYELKRAQEQRTKKVFNGTEYVYDTDQSAISEAEEELADIENEELIAKLEAEQETLDESIELLEEYRSLWAEISEAYDNEINEQLAISIWGRDYEQIILANRLSDIESFKNNYVSIQAEINDNQELIDSYNEKIEYYEALKEQWSDITDAYEEAQEDQYAAMLLGENWEKEVLENRTQTLEDFKNNYISTQQAISDAAWEAANAIVAANAFAANATSSVSSSSVSSTSSSASSSSDDDSETKYKVVDESGNLLAGGFSSVSDANEYKNTLDDAIHDLDNGVKIVAYAAGTENAKRGLNLVGENGTETYIDNEGNAFLVTKPSLISMEGGETVKNAEETDDLFNPDNFIPVGDISDLINAYDNMIPFNSDELWQRIQDIVPNYASVIQPEVDLPRYEFKSVQNNATPVVQHINITLPNVTNTSGYERIQKELRQAQIDAMQIAHRS